MFEDRHRKLKIRYFTGRIMKNNQESEIIIDLKTINHSGRYGNTLILGFGSPQFLSSWKLAINSPLQRDPAVILARDLNIYLYMKIRMLLLWNVYI